MLMSTKTNSPLRNLISQWISRYDQIDASNPFSFSDYLSWLEEEIKRTMQELKEGKMEAIPEEQELLERFKDLGQIQFLPALPIDQAESGLQSGRGVTFWIVEESRLKQFLKLAGYEMEQYAPPVPVEG